MKILVIGGTTFIGRHLVSQLVKQEHEVTVLHRKPAHEFGKKVENLQADRNDPEQMQRALAGKDFDALFDNAYDWERGTPASVVDALGKQLCGHVGRYVFMSRPTATASITTRATPWPPTTGPTATPATRPRASAFCSSFTSALACPW